MRIFIPHQSEKFNGGGSVFIENIKKALSSDHTFVSDPSEEYDVLFIAGATLCKWSTFEDAVKRNKPILLRVDNILYDGRNKNTGMYRLIAFAEKATTIVYQSQWAKKILSPLLGDGIVIYNGVDEKIFHPPKETRPPTSNTIRVFYSKHSRNETKQFHEVQYFWREHSLLHPHDTLVLVGTYARDVVSIDHPFEFHNGERYEFVGAINDRHAYADLIRSCDIALLPYQFDACSNTIIEAQMCGLPVLYSPTGGTPEIIEGGFPIDYVGKTPSDMVRQAYSYRPSLDAQKCSLRFGLSEMGEQYNALLKTLLSPVFEL